MKLRHVNAKQQRKKVPKNKFTNKFGKISNEKSSEVDKIFYEKVKSNLLVKNN